MRRPHRTAHRIIWRVLPVVLFMLLVAALALRPPIPRDYPPNLPAGAGQ